MACLCAACHDNKLETCNAFLIPQTPYTERSDTESAYTQIGMCMLCPIRLVEAIGMMGYGVLTLAVPCFTFDLDSYHYGNNIDIKCCHPGCTWLPSPLHYKYSISGEGNTISKGFSVNLKCGNARPPGHGESFSMTSHTPGGLCLKGGCEKLTSIFCDVLCHQVRAGYWSDFMCCK